MHFLRRKNERFCNSHLILIHYNENFYCTCDECKNTTSRKDNRNTYNVLVGRWSLIVVTTVEYVKIVH